MPKVTIYLPDDLYAEIKRRDLPISRVAQRAFVSALAEDANSIWVARARRRPTRDSALSTESVMSAVDEEFGA